MLLLAAACGDDGGTSLSIEEESGDSGAVAEEPIEAGLGGGGIDPGLTRDDVDCSEAGLGEDAEADFTTAHYVVDGDLGAVCLGPPDATLVEAWEILADITPGGQLRDLAVFGGFESSDTGEGLTLAFVEVLDDDSQFQMAVNLDAAEDDRDEFTLTMAHEFSHVFTSLPSELDRYVAPEDCFTYDNGEGCFLEGSLMDDWVLDFWPDPVLDQIDPEFEAPVEEAEARCDADPGFFGSYAATNPEEDFAEAFSAYVLQVPPDTPEQQARLDFMAARPGLVEFRERAAAAGYGPQENFFDECGLDA